MPHATIFKPQQPYRRCVGETFKDFPAPALALMEILLSIDPADRGSAASALQSEVQIFLFTTFSGFCRLVLVEFLKRLFFFFYTFAVLCNKTSSLRSFKLAEIPSK